MTHYSPSQTHWVSWLWLPWLDTTSSQWTPGISKSTKKEISMRPLGGPDAFSLGIYSLYSEYLLADDVGLLIQQTSVLCSIHLYHWNLLRLVFCRPRQVVVELTTKCTCNIRRMDYSWLNWSSTFRWWPQLSCQIISSWVRCDTKGSSLILSYRISFEPVWKSSLRREARCTLKRGVYYTSFASLMLVWDRI